MGLVSHQKIGFEIFTRKTEVYLPISRPCCHTNQIGYTLVLCPAHVHLHYLYSCQLLRLWVFNFELSMHNQTLAGKSLATWKPVCIHLWSYHFSVQRELKSTLVASDLCKAFTFHWHFPLKSLVSQRVSKLGNWPLTNTTFPLLLMRETRVVTPWH